MPLLLLLALAAACAPSSPDAVRAAAERAAADPDAAEALVRALGSGKPDVRAAAADALVELGANAVPALKAAVSAREPTADEALVVLGRMGHTGSVPLLVELSADPALGDAARQGLSEADTALYRRVQRAPTLAGCDEYLRLFPQGQHAEAVRQERREQEAWDALVAADARSIAALRGVSERFPGSRAAQKAKLTVADLLVEQADAAIREGRPSDALTLLADARTWDAQLDTAAWEARAYKAMGKALAQRSDWDRAIESLEAARRLSATDVNARELSDAYLKRAEERFKRGDPVGGMMDLRGALTTDPRSAPFVEESREYWASALLRDLEGGTPLRGVAAGALVLAAGLYGPEGGAQAAALLDRVDKAARAQQGRGDPLAVLEACRAGLGADPATRERMAKLLALAVAPVERAAATLLADPARQDALLAPPEPWADRARAARAEAAMTLRTYEDTTLLAQQYAGVGLQISRSIPTVAPLDAAALEALFQRGQALATLGNPLHQAQLLRYLLQAPEDVLSLARSDPGRLALVLLNQLRLPADAQGWRLIALEAARLPAGGARGVPLADGRRVDISAERVGAVVRIQVRGAELATGLDPAAIGQLIVVALGVGPALLAADPSAGRVEVIAGAPGTSVLAQRARLVVRREDLSTLSWSAVRAAAPYDDTDLLLLREAELR